MPRPNFRNPKRYGNGNGNGEGLGFPQYLQKAALVVVPSMVLVWLFLRDPKTPYSSLIAELAAPSSSLSLSSSSTAASLATIDESLLHDECFQIPNIRPSGVFFAADANDQNNDNNKVIQNLPSMDGIEPAFRVGTIYKGGNKHMSGDLAHFELIRDYVQQLTQNKNYGVAKQQQPQSKNENTNTNTITALDIGANQGFYTFFLAALELQVHAFEIDPVNFLSLQQGTLYNTKAIADRVYLYPLGLSDTVGRMGSKGSQYEGFLQKDNTGPILSSTLDCFAQHTNLLHRLVPIPSSGFGSSSSSRDSKKLLLLPFVKIDVEGFEMAVLKGVHNSLYHPSVQIGSLLMEVGPKRWSRASIQLAEGIQEMQLLANQFANNFLMLRTPSVAHHQGCPVSLADYIVVKTPERELHGVQLYRLSSTNPDELVTILTAMEKNDYDCNFWYTN